MLFPSLWLLCSLHFVWSQPTPNETLQALTNATTASVQARFSPFFIRDENYAVGAFARVNWYQAQATCAAQGMSLVSISKESDQRRLRNFLYLRANDQLHILNDLLWTSGTDLADENTWTWFTNGRTFVYRNFQNGSPTSGGHCVAFNGITGLWINGDCTHLHYFICERRCADYNELLGA